MPNEISPHFTSGANGYRSNRFKVAADKSGVAGGLQERIPDAASMEETGYSKKLLSKD